MAHQIFPSAFARPCQRGVTDQNGAKTACAYFSLCLMAASLAGLLLLSPIPQDQGYHHFADQRTLLGIPNFWNVISNLPFIAVGAAG